MTENKNALNKVAELKMDILKEYILLAEGRLPTHANGNLTNSMLLTLSEISNEFNKTEAKLNEAVELLKELYESTPFSLWVVKKKVDAFLNSL